MLVAAIEAGEADRAFVLVRDIWLRATDQIVALLKQKHMHSATDTEPVIVLTTD